MYHADIPQFNNIIRDMSSRSLPDSVLQQGENIIFKDGTIQQRNGVMIFISSSLPLDSPITGLSLYNTLRTLDRILIAFTNTDIYRYDKTSGKFKYLTRNYSTGTVTTSGTGYRTVTVSTGTFSTSWNKQHLYKISFDSADINQCTTWYTVLNISSSTVLVLDEDATAKTGSVYCLRLCYSGDIDNAWSIAYPYDPDTDDRTMIATNEVDIVQKWNGSGSCVDLTAYASYCQHIAAFGSKSYHHILCSNTYDPGSATHFRQTIDISDAGAITWTAGTYYELIDKEFELKGIVPLRDQLAIYTEQSISTATIGTAADPLVISENVIRNVGTTSIRTVIDIGSAHIFWSGKSIYMFDGIQVKDVGEGNRQYLTKNVNKSYQHRAFAMSIPEYSLYCLFLPWGISSIPNMCVCYNYETAQWMFWEFNDSSNVLMYLVSQGEYIKTYMPSWNDLIKTPTGSTTNGSNQITNISSTTGIEVGMKVEGTGIPALTYITGISGTTLTLDKNCTATGTAVTLAIGYTWAQMEMRWTDLIVNENFGRKIFGDKNGYIYEYSEDNVTDSGNDIVSSIITKNYPLNSLESDFRLLETVLQLSLKESATGYYSASLTIRASVDAGRTWTDWQTVTLDGNSTYMEKKVYYNIVGKQVCFEVSFSDPLAIEGLRIGFNAQYKSMKFDN